MAEIKGVIDIGSNSVRLMLIAGGISIKKYVEITKLADGLGDGNNVLNLGAIERTATAVCRFNNLAKNSGAKEIWALATAAVRSSSNGSEFTERVYELCGLKVDVISGETEAKLGSLGALSGEDGSVIDIGGASTEIITVKGGKTVYSKSVNTGVVRLYKIAKDDRTLLDKEIDERLTEYGKIEKSEFFGIGGTATSLSAIAQKLEVYDPKKVDGYKLDKESVKSLAEYLLSLSVEERKGICGLQKGREEVIAGGAYLLYKIMEKFKIECITVSEKDNLEGYYIYKTEKL